MLRSHRVALMAISLGMLTVTLDSSALSVATPAISRSFNGSLADLQWVSNAFVLAYAGCILSAGRFADRFGPRTMLISGLLLLAASSLACMMAPTLWFLVTFRFTQGVSGAILVTSGYTLLAHVFGNGPNRAKAFGTLFFVGTIGLSAGPVAGGLLTDAFGWRSIFLLNLVVAATVFVLVRRADDHHDAAALTLDPAGQVLSIVMLSALAIGLIEGGAHGLLGLPGIAFLVAASALAGFIRVERTSASPMLPLSIFRIRAFSAGAIVVGLWRGSLYGLLFFLGLYFQNSLHYSSAKAGLALLPATAGPFITNALSAPLIDWFGVRKVLACGWSVAVAGTALLLLVTPSTPYVLVGAGLFLMSAGAGATVPVVSNVSLAGASHTYAGVASGVYNAGGQTGMLIGIAVVGGFADDAGTSGLHLAALAVTVALACALVLSDRFLVPNGQLARTTPTSNAESD